MMITPLKCPRHRVPPPKKKRGNELIYPKTHTHTQKNKRQKTKTNMHSHKTELLSQHSHTTLHTNQKCRDGDMIYARQINKTIIEKSEGLKIKSAFLKMPPELPLAFSNFVLSVPLNFK